MDRYGQKQTETDRNIKKLYWVGPVDNRPSTD